MVISKKKALFQNLGFEELSYNEIIQMSGLKPTKTIVCHANSLIPRKIPSEYIPSILYFAPNYDGLLYTICLEQKMRYLGRTFSRKYFYSPSMTLFATLMRSNEKEIRKILGCIDILNKEERDKIDLIIDYLKMGKTNLNYSHIKRKRLNNILIPIKVKKIYYNGRAFNTLVPSKHDPSIYYEGFFKQLIKFNGKELKIYPFSQARCDCGYHKASFLKYEYTHILARCSHMELIRQTLENPSLGDNVIIEDSFRNRFRNNISEIFSPFSPLDYPYEKGTPKLRKIIRNGIYNFIVPQKYIQTFYDDKNNRHKNNGFTWFRCELDSFLLSFNECYNVEFLKIWNSNVDEIESRKRTCQFFGDYIIDKLVNVNVTHYFNKHKNKIEHRIDDEWFKVYHYAESKIDGTYAQLHSDQITHDRQGNHILSYDIRNLDLKIKHTVKIRKELINFTTPFQVGKLKNDLLVYITPYKMRKTFRKKKKIN